MKPWIQLTLLGVGAYAVFLVATLPAQLLASQISAQTPARLEGVSGNLWKGQVAQLSVKDIPLGSLRWELSALPLVTGHVSGAFTLDGDLLKGQGEITAGLDSSLEVRDLKLQADPALIQAFTPLPLDLEGELYLRTDALRYPGEGLPTTRAQLVWVKAGITAPYVASLGQYSVDMESDADGFNAALSAEDNPFQTSGRFTLQPNGRYQLTLLLSPKGDTPPELSNMLKLVGRADARGAVTIRKQGQIPGMQAPESAAAPRPNTNAAQVRNQQADD